LIQPEKEHTMEIGASLAQLEIFATDPQASAGFYASTFGLKPSSANGTIACTAPGREVVLVAGEGGQLRRASFRFAQRPQFAAHRALLLSRGVPLVKDGPNAFTLRDPEGRLISFLPPAEAARPASAPGPLEARLQHFGVRSPAPAALTDYYVGALGFVLSDRVLDEHGDLTAAFLRTDAEHHSMAIFRAPAVRFDHFSCEAAGWEELR